MKQDVFSKHTESPRVHEVPKAEPVASPEPPTQERASRGRPQEHQEEWKKVTVVLMEKQIYSLDKLALDIRQNTKSAISRAEIIRALVSAMEESGLDFTHCGSETDVKTVILKKMGKH